MTTMTLESNRTEVPAPVRTTEQTQPLYRFTVDQYHDMIRHGIIASGTRAELLDGLIYSKMGRNPPHRAATLLTRRALERVLPPGVYVDTQEPITTSTSEPEPDVTVIRGDTTDYLDRHPGPDDVLLLIEVSETSLSRDRVFKRRLYAAALVAEYWIINLVDRVVEVRSDPFTTVEDAIYRGVEIFSESESVPLNIDGKTFGPIPVRSLLLPTTAKRAGRATPD